MPIEQLSFRALCEQYDVTSGGDRKRVKTYAEAIITFNGMVASLGEFTEPAGSAGTAAG